MTATGGTFTYSMSGKSGVNITIHGTKIGILGRCRVRALFSVPLQRTQLGGRRFALAHSSSSEHRVHEDGVAPPLQRRKSQSVRARMDAEISAEFSRSRPRKPL